jgi:hypothetical protein
MVNTRFFWLSFHSNSALDATLHNRPVSDSHTAHITQIPLGWPGLRRPSRASSSRGGEEDPGSVTDEERQQGPPADKEMHVDEPMTDEEGQQGPSLEETTDEELQQQHSSRPQQRLVIKVPGRRTGTRIPSHAPSPTPPPSPSSCPPPSQKGRPGNVEEEWEEEREEEREEDQTPGHPMDEDLLEFPSATLSPRSNWRRPKRAAPSTPPSAPSTSRYATRRVSKKRPLSDVTDDPDSGDDVRHHLDLSRLSVKKPRDLRVKVVHYIDLTQEVDPQPARDLDMSPQPTLSDLARLPLYTHSGKVCYHPHLAVSPSIEGLNSSDPLSKDQERLRISVRSTQKRPSLFQQNRCFAAPFVL